MDGTIVDTKDCHFFTWQRALEKHGYTLDHGVFEANFGRNNKTLVPLYLGFQPGADFMEEIIEDKEILFRQIAPQQVSLVPGVISWLSKADEMNFPQAIASSAPMENISMMMEKFDLSNYFETIVSGVELPAKPEPDIFVKAANNLGCLMRDCLVIEDSLAGVQAAKIAGMRCIAVTTSHPRTELGLADLVVDDFTGSLEDALRTLCWF